MTIAQFDALYANRHLAEVRDECSSVLQGALEHGQEFEWLWRAARLEHFRAMQASEAGDHSAAKGSFTRGAEFARQAEAQAGERVEGVFWRATCDLEAARQEGTLAVARVLSGAQKRLERACGRDETFHFAGPLRVLGRVIQFKPLLLGGSLDRAIAFYDRALQIAPTNSTTLLYRADALLSDRQPALARQTLHALLQVPNEGWKWECERDQNVAREWLHSRLD